MATVSDLAARYERIPSGTLFDVLERHGHGDSCVLGLDIAPLVLGRLLAGPVHTIRWARDPRRPEDMPPAAVGRPPISPLFRGMQAGSAILVDGAQGPVRIRPGDWPCCDDDVIAVPAAIVEDVLAECEALEDVEQRSCAEMLTGDVDEVFTRYRRG